MLDAEETAQLRALQARAYGRDSALTAADAARLEELEAQRNGASRAETPTRPTPDEPSELTSSAQSAGRETSERSPFSSDAPDAPDADGSDESPAATAAAETRATARALRPAIRRHWRAVAVGCAGLLVVGLGAGWALFGRHDGVPLSADEKQRGAAIESAGDYDPGTVEAIARDGDAIVWFGTKKNGEIECIVLDAAGESSNGCQITADLDRGYGLSAAVIDSRLSDEGMGEQISAVAGRAHDGDMTALIQRWAVGADDWMQQFDAEERERAEELLDRGYEPYSLSIMGYAAGAPIWTATRTEEFTTTQCLIVDAVDATNCIDADNGMIPGEGVAIEGVNVDDAGEQTTPWSVTLDYTPMGRSYLIVTGEILGGDGTDAEGITTGTVTVRPGESPEVDVPSGDAG
nr:hypothetical protein [Microbacterium hydrocarbonoxydans]